MVGSLRLAVVAPFAFAACATVTAGRVQKSQTARPTADASGVWDWIYRSTDEQGDMRVEQEEWHLVQHGARIEGYYDRAVTMMSTDERLFRCNQKLGFTKLTRVRVAGNVESTPEGDHVILREVGFDAKPGPCDDGARNLVAYVGTMRGGTLLLKWGPEAAQTLVRRDMAGATPLVQSLDVAPREQMTSQTIPASNVTMSLPLAGTWVWELRSIDAEGDERIEREEWHLTEGDTGISGYYDRTVTRVRGDGTFACNSEPRYETATRYTVAGQRFGEKLTLTEVEYKAQPSKCDNALRRLDTYQGQLADADNLILSWGPGNQLLRRQR